MEQRTYWLDLFTAETWAEYRSAGSAVSGFSEHRWPVVQRMRRGDVLLCYLTGISRFIGALEVTSEPYQASDVIWTSAIYPSRVRTRVIHALQPDTAVPLDELRARLSKFKDLRPGAQWTGPLRGSPAAWSEEDGQVVMTALAEASATPVVRPYDPRKLARPGRRQVAQMARGSEMTALPEEPAPSAPTSADSPDLEIGGRGDSRAHTEIQWILGRLANDLGLSVWIPPSDRNQVFGQNRIADLRFGELPMMFGPKVLRTVRNIDVIWLGEGSIEAAFEIESTTSIYSGLLRLADLVALVPNIAIPLFIAAPDDRRANVAREVTRPTFNRLQPPLSRICRYLPFSTLRNQMPTPGMLPFTSPQFIGAFSEPCLPADENPLTTTAAR